MTALFILLIGPIAIFAMTIYKIMRNSYDAKEAWTNIGYLVFGWIVVGFLFFALFRNTLFSTEASASDAVIMSLVFAVFGTAGVTLLALRKF